MALDLIGVTAFATETQRPTEAETISLPSLTNKGVDQALVIA